MPMLPGAWRAWAWVILAVGIVSVLYGALVALAQTDLKRMIAYTSVNHMGYVVLGVGAAGTCRRRRRGARGRRHRRGDPDGQPRPDHRRAVPARRRAARPRRHLRDGRATAGSPAPAPRFATLFAVAAFASLGLPGFSGFIAEFQVFTGSIAAVPVAALALPGILVTAALFLRALQRVFTGATGRAVGGLRRPARRRGLAGGPAAAGRAAARGPAPAAAGRDRARRRRRRPDWSAGSRGCGPREAPLALLPEICLLVGALLALMGGSFLPRRRQWVARAHRGRRAASPAPARPPPGWPGPRHRLRRHLRRRHRHRRRPDRGRRRAPCSSSASASTSSPGTGGRARPTRCCCSPPPGRSSWPARTTCSCSPSASCSPASRSTGWSG